MAICQGLGGAVEGGHEREFGRADIVIQRESPLLEGLGGPGDREPVWMSHGDKITAMPEGFDIVATSEGSPYAVIADEARRFYGIQFHPEVAHTPRGALILRNFTHRIAGLSGDWTMAAFRDEAIARIRTQVGQGKVICGLSGGGRQLRRRHPDPRGDRRATHLRVRRHWAVEGRGGGSGGDAVPRPLQHPADPCGTPARCFSAR